MSSSTSTPTEREDGTEAATELPGAGQQQRKEGTGVALAGAEQEAREDCVFDSALLSGEGRVMTTGTFSVDGRAAIAA